MMETMSSENEIEITLTHKLSGREVSRLSFVDERHLRIHFIDGSSVLIGSYSHGITVEICQSDPNQPTKRQGDYLRFISKYIHQFGRPPAESDIQRHFLVAAPSVNHMMQTLEKRGFITRQPGVARSIQLRIPI